MYLATKFDLENNVIKDDVANIEINAEIVECALGLPSCGDEFPEYYPDDSEYEALKSRWIFTWIKDAIKDFQKKGVKHLSACMFVVVVIYFQWLKWGQLNRCRSAEQWIIDWSLKNLEHRATTALKKIRKMMDDKPQNKLRRKKGKKKNNKKKNSDKKEEDEIPLVQRKTIDDQEERKGYNTHEEEPINNERDNKSEEGVIKDKEVLKRWTQIEEELRIQRRTIGIEKKKLAKEQEAEIEATLKDAAECFMIDFHGYDEDISSFSLGFSQEFKSLTHIPKRSMQEEIFDIQPLNEIIPVNIPFQQAENPISMGPTRKLTTIEQKKIYNWIINWKIKEFNNSNLPRFTNEFYCVESGILDTILIDWNLVAYETREEYFGVNPNLGLDKENFDKEKAATRQWWLIPICHRRHWYLYAFNVVKRKLLVLDSMFDHPFDDKRKIVDLYVVTLKLGFNVVMQKFRNNLIMMIVGYAC
ncbi:hypothetical protein PIB30_049841 [Stylosanthes scabra]|uniref:Ubiquitin-like protease family profile domain-containing protein n=1 Tax=Stylosanthes scabra TaxID=79078 RepID=A0ABU6YHN8_9FABA|nr:hypothetical protein [Stylosanthes scabra]